MEGNEVVLPKREGEIEELKLPKRKGGVKVSSQRRAETVLNFESSILLKLKTQRN